MRGCADLGRIAILAGKIAIPDRFVTSFPWYDGFIHRALR